MADEVETTSELPNWLFRPDFPEHWQRQPLYSFARWVNGLPFRDIQFSPTGKPVIKIAEIKGGITGQTKFTKQTFDDSVFVKSGDMLFSWSGQPETSIDAFWWRGQDGWLNQHIFKVIPKEELDPTFFFYILRYLKPNFIAIARNKQTTGLGHVTKRDLENIEAAFPSLPEQKCIASVLGALDDKIELNRRMNATLEVLAQSLFKSWFVDATINGLPKGWREGTLGHLVELQVDRVETTTAKNNERYIALEDMPSKSIDLSNYQLGSAVNSSIIAFRKGDILFGSMRPYFHKVGIASFDGITRTTTFVLRPKHEHLRHFALFHFFSNEVVEFATTASVGTTIPYVRWNSLERYDIALPPEPRLEAFEKAVAPFVQRIAANGEESRTLAALRDALLPKLLSGALRVPQAEQNTTNIIPLFQLPPVKSTRKAPDEFVEAIAIAYLTRQLFNGMHPLGRKRYNKLVYLAHRKAEDDVSEHFLKKAAGPYSPWAKYQGPEAIAFKKGYVKNGKVGDYTGFLPGDNIAEIDRYVPNYPICAAIDWVIGKFKFRKNDDLELLATVDYAALDLLLENKPVSLDGIKQVIAANKEWMAKLKREIFSDANITRALAELRGAFPKTYTT